MLGWLHRPLPEVMGLHTDFMTKDGRYLTVSETGLLNPAIDGFFIGA